VAEAIRPTTQEDAASIVAQLADISRDMTGRVGIDLSNLGAVAVGVPGVVGAGLLRMAPNLPPFHDLDLTGCLERAVGVRVAIDNDVNMATVGEKRRGLGVGCENFVFLAVGTGIGLGIVAGGQLQRGATGAAGEIGELPLTADIQGSAGKLIESLEEVAGGTAAARRFAQRTNAPGLPTTAMSVFAAAATDQNADALAVLDEQARAVAFAVIAVQLVLDPQIVVLGGGIGSRPDFLAQVRGCLPRLSDRQIHVEPSALGPNAGAMGAVETALELAMGQSSSDRVVL
jgi:predicted NBD/HSP70 family sugar kinase